MKVRLESLTVSHDSPLVSVISEMRGIIDELLDERAVEHVTEEVIPQSSKQLESPQEVVQVLPQNKEFMEHLRRMRQVITYKLSSKK